MVKGDHGGNAVLVAAGQHAPVVLELRLGELSLLRLDAGPFDREPVSIEPKVGKQCYVLWIAMIVVTGIAGGLPAWRA